MMNINLEKNQIIHLEIMALSNEGLGIGRYNGVVIFVSGGVPEDLVEAKIVKIQKHHCFAIIEQIVKSSSYRMLNDCPSFPQCGGCKLRHLRYEKELELKNSFVKENLNRIGKVNIELEPIIRSPLKERYRNKAQYPIAVVDGEVRVGFYASRSHRLIPLHDCLLQPKEFSVISKLLCDFAQTYKLSVYNEETGKGLLRHLCIRNGLEKIMVTVVINGSKLPNYQELVKKLMEIVPNFTTLTLSHHTQKNNIIMGKTQSILYGEGIISDELCGVNLQLSANSFYQVNKRATEVLYTKVDEYAKLKSNEILLDLYCGIGSIGLSLAGKAKELIGVELIDQAVEDAKENARRNNINNARFICADAGKAAEELSAEGLYPDVVIVDPPRKGIDQLTIDSVCKMNPSRIVYVSCNSATLARDVKLLEEKGYKMTKGVAVDMFPRTNHVECVALLEGP